MRTNPFHDGWVFLIGRTDEHAASGVGWLLTISFLALLAASIWIARTNWLEDAGVQLKVIVNHCSRMCLGEGPLQSRGPTRHTSTRKKFPVLRCARRGFVACRSTARRD
jgi:hypothetical protein